MRKYLFRAFGVGAIGSLAFLKYSTQENEDSLVNVIFITRHGARTPLHVYPKTFEQAEYKKELIKPIFKVNCILKNLNNVEFEDFLSYKDKKYSKNKLKGDAYIGQLTTVGQEQMFNLGQKIKEKYARKLRFISSQYNPDEIYVRSTHLQRTLNSAKCFLAGIYQDSIDQETKIPFQIYVHSLEYDYLYPNLHDCSYLEITRESLKFKKDLYTNQSNEYNKFLNYTKEKFNLGNQDVNTIFFFNEFLDDYNSRKVISTKIIPELKLLLINELFLKIHNIPVPQDLESFAIEASQFAVLEMFTEMRENIKLNCGQFIGLIRDNILDVIKNDQSNKPFHKFIYYSAHDTTLNSIIVALNIMNEKNFIWPPFGANVTIELWKTPKQNSYYLKLYYCDDELKLSQNLDEFLKILEKNSLDRKSYLDVCNSKLQNAS